MRGQCVVVVEVVVVIVIQCTDEVKAGGDRGFSQRLPRSYDLGFAGLSTDTALTFPNVA